MAGKKGYWVVRPRKLGEPNGEKAFTKCDVAEVTPCGALILRGVDTGALYIYAPGQWCGAWWGDPPPEGE